MQDINNKMENAVGKIYNLCSILKDYCKTNQEDLEEVCKIYTLVEYIHRDVDRLYSRFINSQN